MIRGTYGCFYGRLPIHRPIRPTPTGHRQHRYTFVEDVQNAKSCTVLIKGPNQHTIAQARVNAWIYTHINIYIWCAPISYAHTHPPTPPLPRREVTKLKLTPFCPTHPPSPPDQARPPGRTHVPANPNPPDGGSKPRTVRPTHAPSATVHKTDQGRPPGRAARGEKRLGRPGAGAGGGGV